MAKIFSGRVKVAKQEKTVVVEVERFYNHPKYEKRMKRSKRYQVHDELGVKEGDVVRFIETRPLSKTKRWKVVEIVSKGKKKK